MKRRLKINGVIMAIAFLSVAAFPAIFIRRNPIGFLEESAEIIGLSLILSGQIIRVSARGYKSQHSNGGYSLIQNGPYSLVRNPMYLGIILIGIGVVLMLLKWWVAGIFLLVFVVRYFKLIFKEEKTLQRMFSRDYEEYCRKTPRILPSLFILMTKDMNEYLPLKMAWFKKEIGSILTLLFIVLFVESWEDIKQGGIKTYLGEMKWLVAMIILFICLVIALSRRTENFKKDDSERSKSN